MSYSNRKSEQKTFQQQLVYQASLSNRTYSYTKIQPSVFFWKQLTTTSLNSPSCLIPDTLVINQKQSQLIWMYTNEAGKICRETNINFKDFVLKLSSYSSPNQLVAILKRPIFNQSLAYTNDFKLINSRYLLNTSQQQMGQKQHVMCLQRFIKSNGSRAFICRTIYSSVNSSQCFLITNTRNFFDKNESEVKKFTVKPGDKSTLVKSKQGKNLQETSQYLKNIVQYMKFHRGIQMTELTGDFIKDEMENWWLVNIKSFKIVQKVRKNPKQKTVNLEQSQLQKQRYQKTKMCRYCQKSYLQSELTFKMTMRMIIEVDKYLLHLGKQYNWLKRSDVSNIDSHFLYQQHKVCQRCFRLYSQIQELMQIQRKLLVKQGCQLIAHPKQLILNQTNQQQLRLQVKNKQIHRLNQGIPNEIQLGPNSNITICDKYPVKNDELKNKMIRMRMIIFFNQIDEVVGVNPSYNYYLEFVLFGKKTKFKLNLQFVERKIIPLNRLKVFYFFVNSLDNLQLYFNSCNALLKIYIVMEHKQTQQKKNQGYLQLQLKDLVMPPNRKKDFYKFFHLNSCAYGWGLEASIGIISSETEVSTAKISFQKTEGQIYIPNQFYYFCQHLTQQWIDLINNKNRKALKHKSSSIYPHVQPQLDDLQLKQKQNISDLFKEQIKQQKGIEQKQDQLQRNSGRQLCWSNILNQQIDSYTKLNEKKGGSQKRKPGLRPFNLYH